MEITVRHNSNSACFKVDVMGYEVSVAFDQPLRDKDNIVHFTRSDIKVYDPSDKDVTREVTGHDFILGGNFDSISTVVEQVRKHAQEVAEKDNPYAALAAMDPRWN